MTKPTSSGLCLLEVQFKPSETDMAQPHIKSGQKADISPFGDQLSEKRSVALLKTQHLEVIRLVLKPGQTIPPHKLSGDITIQCIEGKLNISLASSSIELEAGELAFLESDLSHGVTALEASSALVTIAFTGTSMSA